MLTAFFVWHQRPVSFPVPEQNGYQNFLRAVTLLPDETVDFNDEEALVDYVHKCQEAFHMVQSGLELPVTVPIEASTDWIKRHQEEAAGMKRLTIAMIAKAKLAEVKGNTNAAFDAYMEAFRFSNSIGRRGHSLDLLVSFSCRALVLKNAGPLTPSFTVAQAEDFLNLIQKSELEQETPGTVARRSRRWARATFQHGLDNTWMDVKEAFSTFSLSPFTAPRGLLLEKELFYETEHVEPITDSLKESIQVNSRPQ